MTVSYENYRRQALHQIDNLAKPPGSLGLLEKQAKQILLAWGLFIGNCGQNTSFLPPTMALSKPVSLLS